MSVDTWSKSIKAYLEQLTASFSSIDADRRGRLEQVSDYIRTQSEPQIVVICTHNSRRSHFGQIWLQVAADYYGQPMKTFSGGTAATAFHPNAVEAIRRSGFEVAAKGEAGNPMYTLTYRGTSNEMSCYSKKFDHPDNPADHFGAIMVCSDAAEACPFVPGAEKRFVLPYEDPKVSDGTGHEQEVYDARCREIATEMFYIMSRV